MISFEDPLKRKTAGLLTPVRRLLNGEPAHDARVYLLFAGKLASKKKISAALAAYGAAAPLQFKAGDAAGALRTAKLLLCFPEGGLLGAGLALDAAQEILAAGGAETALAIAFETQKRRFVPDNAPDVFEKICAVIGERTGLSAVRRLYARALRVSPGEPLYRYHLGLFCGRFGDRAAMRKELSAFLSCPGDARPVERYVAALMHDDYMSAVRTAEKIIDAPENNYVYSRLWNPWGDRKALEDAAFVPARLAALETARFPEGLGFYRDFYRGIFNFFGNDRKAALKIFDATPPLPPGRYGWMRFTAGWLKLYGCDYDGARREFETASRCRINIHAARGRLAEIAACRGRLAEALSIFAELKADGKDLGSKYAWEGQLRLFAGDWKGALKCLESGIKYGDDAAYCWRGAARFKLGDPGGALRDLDYCLCLFPTDHEARVWRAEVLREQGEADKALAELDHILRRAGDYDMALLNRAIIYAGKGRLEEARRDLTNVDGAILAAAGADAGGLRPARASSKFISKTCRALLDMAKGDRRNDRYFRAMWLAPSRTE